MSADETDRADASVGLDVEAIENLVAELNVAPWLDGFEVKGILRARVIRACGVSLEFFEEAVDESVLIRFVPSGSPNAPIPPVGDVEVDLEADDPPDIIAGDAVELGAYLIEHLALALTPFPRKPGVEFEPHVTSGSISPFAALAHLKSAPPRGNK
jgi:hypothetical protein